MKRLVNKCVHQFNVLWHFFQMGNRMKSALPWNCLLCVSARAYMNRCLKGPNLASGTQRRTTVHEQVFKRPQSRVRNATESNGKQSSVCLKIITVHFRSWMQEFLFCNKPRIHSLSEQSNCQSVLFTTPPCHTYGI